MRPQEVVFAMGEMFSGSWAVWFGFFWCSILLVCAPFYLSQVWSRAIYSDGNVTRRRPQESAHHSAVATEGKTTASTQGASHLLRARS